MNSWNKISTWEQVCKFEKLIKINDDYNYIIKNNNTNKWFLIIENNFNKKEILEKNVNKCLEKVNLRIEIQCNLIDYSTIINEDDFNKNYRLRYFYEITNNNLVDYNLDIRNKPNFLLEWGNLGLNYINISSLKNFYHYDFRPFYIFFEKISSNHNIYYENYKFKFLEYIYDYSKNYKDIQIENIIDPNKKIYLNNEILFKLKNKNKIELIEIQKNNYFALGLIILEFGLKKDIQNIYDRKLFYIKKEILIKYFLDFKNKYKNNFDLFNLLNNLLENYNNLNDNNNVKKFNYKLLKKPFTSNIKKIKIDNSKSNKSCEVKDKFNTVFKSNKIINNNNNKKKINLLSYKFIKKSLKSINNCNNINEILKKNNSMISNKIKLENIYYKNGNLNKNKVNKFL